MNISVNFQRLTTMVLDDEEKVIAVYDVIDEDTGEVFSGSMCTMDRTYVKPVLFRSHGFNRNWNDDEEALWHKVEWNEKEQEYYFIYGGSSYSLHEEMIRMLDSLAIEHDLLK